MRLPNRTRFIVALAVGITTLLAAGRGSAEDIILTASTGTGILYGIAKEFVYDTSNYNGQSYTQSELDWDLHALLMTKAALNMRTPAGFVASLDVQLGIPWKTGLITDSDWLNYSYNGDPTKTNFSQHDCYTERAVLLDAKAGWEFPVASWVTLEPFLAFGFMDFKWTARDGYLQYPPGYIAGSATKPYPDYSTDVVVPVSGTGIIYQQTYYIPAVGLSAKIHSGSLSGAISYAISPLVFCNDVDNHEFGAPGSDYYDTMSNGLLLEPKISLEWQIGRSRLSLDVAYRHIAGLIGNTTRVYNGVGYPPGQVAATYVNGAGASYDVVGASISFDWAL
jgi:outer membrane protease